MYSLFLVFFSGVGIQWDNIASSTSVDDPFTMLHVMLMLLLDAFLYAVIAWYVEAVFPGQYGIPLKWYFPFTVSYNRHLNICSFFIVNFYHTTSFNFMTVKLGLEGCICSSLSNMFLSLGRRQKQNKHSSNLKAESPTLNIRLTTFNAGSDVFCLGH